MSTVVIRSLTIKEMQDYYDRISGGRGTYINRGAFETWNPKIRAGEIKLPPEFACVSDGKVFTWAMVMERRRQRQVVKLEQRRSDYDVTYKKPLYVWVFWCPGVGGFAFRGWWTYFVGLGRDYHGGGYKGEADGKLKDDLLRLFPLTGPNLFETNWDEWMKRFVKKYRRGTWCGKPQGKSPVWAEVQGGRIKRLLGMAEWPGDRGRKSEDRGRNVSEKCG